MAELLGDRIRKARRRCGLSGAQLARLIEVPRQHLYAVETNRTREPSALLVERIAEALNVSADYLLSGRLEPRRPLAALDESHRVPAQLDLVAAE
jgi:transcriptional regulator with XRE-family HTH domain